MNYKTQDTKECLFCGASLLGRRDKKYCDDNCRNNHYYHVNKESNAQIREINNVLIHNRSVLSLLCRGAKKVINKQNLIDKNFDFNYITSFYKTKKGECYKKVYDFAYKINNDIVVIVRC